MLKELLQRPHIRAAAVGIVLATGGAHIEKANAQVNSIQLVDCSSEKGLKNNTATIPFLEDGDFSIYNGKVKSYDLSTEGNMLHVKPDQEEGVRSFTLVPEGTRLEENPLSSGEVYVTGGRIPLQLTGSETKVEIQVRKTSNLFITDLYISCNSDQQAPKKEDK